MTFHCYDLTSLCTFNLKNIWIAGMHGAEHLHWHLHWYLLWYLHWHLHYIYKLTERPVVLLNFIFSFSLLWFFNARWLKLLARFNAQQQLQLLSLGSHQVGGTVTTTTLVNQLMWVSLDISSAKVSSAHWANSDISIHRPQSSNQSISTGWDVLN